MIDLYTWKTPNGRKAAIMLAESGLPHLIHPVDITKGEQRAPAFLAISPNNKIPAIVDRREDDDPGASISLFESGAILEYLAEKSGMLLPTGVDRWTVLQWVYWSIGGLGPMLGQLNFFVNYAKTPTPAAIERYTGEAKRLLAVLEGQLTRSPWIGSDAYSIADIVSYPWVAEARERLGDALGPTFAAAPALSDWFNRVGERPAVKVGMAVLEDVDD